MTFEATSWMSEFGNLTATAVLGWYAWHTAAKTIPTILRAFRDEMAAMRTEFRTERESLHAQLTAERIQRHHDHLGLVDALNDLSERIHAERDSAAPGQRTTTCHP